jgi:hypothetical protein
MTFVRFGNQLIGYAVCPVLENKYAGLNSP